MFFTSTRHPIIKLSVQLSSSSADDFSRLDIIGRSIWKPHSLELVFLDHWLGLYAYFGKIEN